MTNSNIIQEGFHISMSTKRDPLQPCQIQLLNSGANGWTLLWTKESKGSNRTGVMVKSYFADDEKIEEIKESLSYWMPSLKIHSIDKRFVKIR